MSRFGRDGRHRAWWDSVTLVIIGLLVPTLASGQTTKEAAVRAPVADDGDGARKDYAQISLEELLNKDVTVAATKTRVDVAKAPVSVTVLTPEDIRLSGAVTLGELLRTIPGIDVLESFPSHISVSARGTSEAAPNNTLFLIDGRRLESKAFDVTFLEEASVRLEDIKRIEVVRGPVGALYGTNALACVVSITTYSPDEVPGTMVSIVGGNRDTYMASVRQAGKLDGTWAYKVVGGYSYTSTWGSMTVDNAAPPIATRKADALALLEGKLANDSKLVLEAGFSRGELASLTVVTNQTQDYVYPHLRLAYNRPKFHSQITYNPQWLELRERVPPIQPLKDQWSHAINLSVDHTLNPIPSSTMTVGGNVRYQRSQFTTILTPHDQLVGSVFLQNQQSLASDRLILFGAVGLSRHPELDLQVDGNAAIVLAPVRNHTLRVSFGRAHRDPAFNENYNNFRRQIGSASALLAGRTDLRPETIRAWEAGYRGRFPFGGTSRLAVFADVFTEDINDLIGSVTRPVPRGSLPQAPDATIFTEFRNLEARDGKGFEVGAEVETSAVRLLGHYSYQEFKTLGTGATIQADVPKHKVSAGLQTHKGPVEFSVWVHSVSNAISPSVSREDQSYVLLNPWLGVKAGRWMFSAQAFNAFNDRHIETANVRNLAGEKIGRSVSFNVRYIPYPGGRSPPLNSGG
jgi:outer membrane receptor protein involved in Fe transport